MHGMDKKKRRRSTALVKDCKLSELGKCKKRFRPKTYNQKFCKPEHQAKYWRIIKSEKRLVVRLLGDHENRIKELERKIKKLEKITTPSKVELAFHQKRKINVKKISI